MKKKSPNTSKVTEILNVIISYAQLDFNAKVNVKNTGNDLDALGAGVNMLGEELNASALSLKEKELMLREIHHRVKNNLQIISSLLNLQVKNDSDGKLREYARESQSRIKAISLIHEMLYQSPDFKFTNFKEYVERLVDMLQNTFSSPDLTIGYEIAIEDDVFFDIDKLIPIGLIINESVSNSIKYAFPNGKGTVGIKMKRENTGDKIWIYDNGIGLKSDFSIENDGNMGIQLIHILSEQIEMKVVMKNHIGLTYELKL